MPSYFSYKLVTPEKIYLEGNAEIITVPGVEGDIGFLAQHTNFITSIRICVNESFLRIHLKTDNKQRK